MPCAPGMAACHLTCKHREFVTAYRAERQRQERISSDMYDVERAHYLALYPLITFKQWLTLHAISDEIRESA